MKSREVVVIYHDHLDPVWARCNDRPTQYNNTVLRSYSDVCDWVIDNYLDMTDEGFTFTEGQVIIWDTYIRKHPEKADVIKKLLRENKLEFMRQGMSTVDSNYSPAEGIIRNQLLAETFYNEYCDDDHWALQQGFIWDAFGNSANMPQIMKEVGIKIAGGTKYRLCPDDWWYGIDGTKLPCIDQIFSSYNRDNDPILYVLSRHPSCPVCHGKGCPECDGRGMINAHPYHKSAVRRVLKETAEFQQPKKFVMIGGEETITDHSIIDAINELNAEYDDVHFRFGTMKEFWEYYEDYYMSKEEMYNSPTVDLNPANQGGYLTRIKDKQRAHELGNSLIQAEAAFAAENWNAKTVCPTPDDLTLAWKDLAFSIHHDAISGGHINSCEDELQQILEEGISIARNYTCRSKYRAPRLGKDMTQAGVCCKKLGNLEIEYDLLGIRRILKDGVDVFGEYHLTDLGYTGTSSRELRIGELALQDEIGNCYSSISTGDFILLGEYNYHVSEGEDFIWWRGAREVMDPSCKKLRWDVYVTVSEDGSRVNYSVDVDWESYNRRLRAIFPVDDHKSLNSIWGIPFGHIERRFDPNEKFEMKVSDNGSMTTAEYDFQAIKPVGDYPSHHWVRHDIGENKGVALFQKGLPCVKWLPGCLQLSLLHSPQSGGISVLPHAEELWDIDGLVDSGKHHFDYSIMPITSEVANSTIAQIGYQYNDATPELPFKVNGSVVVTTFKVAEAGDGFIVRLYEADGKDGPVTFQFDETIQLSRVNALEKDLNCSLGTASHFQYDLHKFEIATFKITRE